MAKGLHWSENDLNKLNDRQEKVRLNQLRDEVIAKRGVPKAEKQRRTTFKKSMDDLVKKPKYRYIIGIDPDLIKCGISIWSIDDEEFITLTAVPISEIIDIIRGNYLKVEILIRVDAGWLNNKSNFHYSKNALTAQKIAHGVGQNAGYGKAICDVLRGLGYEVEEVKPTKSKYSIEAFHKLTNNKYKDNLKKLMTFKQEIVDAALLSYKHK